MTLYLITIILLQWCSIEIINGQMPPQMPKYFQMGNMPPMRSNGPMMTGMPNMPIPYPPTFQTFTPSMMNSYQSFNFPNLPTLQNLPSIPNVPNFSNLPNFHNVPNFSSLPPPMSMSMAPPMPSIQSLAPFPMSNVPNLPMPLPKNLLDPTVLNNLAVALHLLILSNLMNPPEASPEPNNQPRYPAEPNTPQTPSATPVTYAAQNTQPQPPKGYPQQPPQTQVQGYFPSEVPEQSNFIQQNPSFTPPNSKFLGNSGFADAPPVSSMIGVPSFAPGNCQNSNPRAGCSLMSPYEALGPVPSQGFSTDVFSQYGPQNLKADFQSPYQSITANDNTSKDLFSMF